MKFVFISVLFNGERATEKISGHVRRSVGMVSEPDGQRPSIDGQFFEKRIGFASTESGRDIDLPPWPSDDGLTRRPPEASDGKIFAGTRNPARCWNATGSCSSLRRSLSLLVRRGPLPVVGSGPRDAADICHNSRETIRAFPCLPENAALRGGVSAGTRVWRSGKISSRGGVNAFPPSVSLCHTFRESR